MSKGKKKSLVGYAWKDFNLFWLSEKQGGYADTINGIYKNKKDMLPKKGIIKVRITIEEI